VIQAIGLALAAGAAVGMLLADRFHVLLACWTLGAVLQAALAASGRSQRTAAAARQAFLVEILGAWCLAIGGLGLVLASGTGELDVLRPRLLQLDQGRSALPFAGLGVLLAVTARLGLPPLPLWPPRVAGAPPAVRIGLHAGLHPATALLLWHRLDAWLLPWHRTAAIWFGAAGALLLLMAAAGERHGARRAAWLGTAQWAGLFAACAAGPVPQALVWWLAAGLAVVHGAVGVARFPLVLRRTALGVGILAAFAVAIKSGVASRTNAATVVQFVVALGTAGIFWRWWRELPQPASADPGPGPRRAPLAVMSAVTRLGQGPGPLYALLERLQRLLARLVAGFDRFVLDGICEGLGWFGVGLGWLAAWLDRRGLDLVDHGAGVLVGHLGRGAAEAVGRHPARVLIWTLVTVLGLILLWRVVG